MSVHPCQYLTDNSGYTGRARRQGVRQMNTIQMLEAQNVGEGVRTEGTGGSKVPVAEIVLLNSQSPTKAENSSHPRS